MTDAIHIREVSHRQTLVMGAIAAAFGIAVTVAAVAAYAFASTVPASALTSLTFASLVTSLSLVNTPWMIGILAMGLLVTVVGVIVVTTKVHSIQVADWRHDATDFFSDLENQLNQLNTEEHSKIGYKTLSIDTMSAGQIGHRRYAIFTGDSNTSTPSNQPTFEVEFDLRLTSSSLTIQPLSTLKNTSYNMDKEILRKEDHPPRIIELTQKNQTNLGTELLNICRQNNWWQRSQ